MSRFIFQKDEFDDRTFILAGKKAHLFQYADGGFRTKWTGFWAPPFKYLDFYVYNINGNWLDSANAISFEYHSGYAVRKYQTPCFDITETMYIPNEHPSLVSILTITNKTGKDCALNLKLDIGINIRKKEENWHMRCYDIDSNSIRNSLIVSQNDTDASLTFGSGKIDSSLLDNIDISFKKKCGYRDHYPGGEKQRVMDLGSYEIECIMEKNDTITLPFVFTASHISKKHLLDNHDCVVNNWNDLLEKTKRDCISYSSNILDCPNPAISKAFTCSTMCLKNFLHDSDEKLGMFAGYPWFLEFWGRDAFWSLLGLVDAGDFDSARKILIDYAKTYDNTKGLPTLVSTSKEKKYYSDDIDPLFIIALNYYIDISGDDNLFHKLAPVVKRMIDRISKTNKDSKMIRTDPEGTWMDSYRREGNAIDIQALWIEALRYHDKSKSDKLKTMIEILYWNTDTRYFYDTYGESKDSAKTINPVISLMFNQMSHFKTIRSLDVIRKEFMTPFGARTRSVNDSEYHAESYHKGSCWGLTTGWSACAFFRHHFNSEGLDMLRSMAQYIDRDAIGALPETVSAHDGRNLGAGMQAWSSALYIHAIDHYMLGISADSRKNHLTIIPRIPYEWDSVTRKSKRIHNNYIDIFITQNTCRYRVSIKFKNKPNFSMSLVFPGKIKKIMYKGKEYESNKIKLNHTEKDMVFEGIV